MKIFENKTLFKKIAFLLILIVIISFCLPQITQAKDDDEGLGGILLKPIIKLFLSLGDGLIKIVHTVTVQQTATLITVNLKSEVLEVIFTALAFVTIAAVTAVVVYFTAGAAVAALAAVGVTVGQLGIGTLVVVSVGAGVFGAAVINQNYLDDKVSLPLYSVTPQEIFSNKIPLFDVDFFNPGENKVITTEKKEDLDGSMSEGSYEWNYRTARTSDTLHNAIPNTAYELGKIPGFIYVGPDNDEDKKNEYYYLSTFEDFLANYGLCERNVEVSTLLYGMLGSPPSDILDKLMENKNIDSINSTITKKTKKINGYTYNIYEWYILEHGAYPKNYILYETDYGVGEGNGQNVTIYLSENVKYDESNVKLLSTSRILQPTVSTWYKILRNIALVLLLSVLVYVGIRIVISSTSADKAKYKQMLVDWIIAICLLFVMHYIMSFSNTIVNKITSLLNSSIQFPEYAVLIPNDGNKVLEAIKSISDELKAYGLIPESLSEKDASGNMVTYEYGENGYWDAMVTTTESGDNYLLWYTDLMGYVRLATQESKNEGMDYVGYTIMFCVLVLFTIYFVFTYLKRVLYMAFLTIVAPLVALTYPIDKMNDGKAQAFSMWLKEYIFNLLLQPLHLLLYVVLVSSAIELAETNVIYGIVAIAFMIPAEKLLRKFFGFEKAQTPGLLAGPAGSALAFAGLQKLMHRPPKPGDRGGKSRDDEDNEKAPRFNSDFDKEEAMLNAGNEGDYKSNYKEEKDLESDKTGGKNDLNDINEALGIEDSSNKFESPYSQDELEDIYGSDINLKDIDKNPNVPKVDNKVGINKTSNLNREKKKIQRSPMRAFKAGAKYYGKGLLKKAANSTKNIHPFRAAAGLLGAATFATAGGIIGLTSGDPSKILQYTTTGAVGGYNAGKSAASGLESALDVRGTKEAAERAYYGSNEELEKAQKEKYIKQLKKNEEIQEAFRRNTEMDEDQINRLMKSDFVDSYVDAGITDINDIIVGYQMENEKNLSRGETIAGIKQANKFGDTSKMDQEQIDRVKRRLSSDFAKNERVQKENRDAQALANKTFDIANTAWKYKGKMK